MKKADQAEGSTPESSTKRVRMQIHKVNTMQTILLSQVLSLIQWSWLTITMKIVFF